MQGWLTTSPSLSPLAARSFETFRGGLVLAGPRNGSPRSKRFALPPGPFVDSQRLLASEDTRGLFKEGTWRTTT
jgi:hypothetical protein